jgi:hypothetical protein
MDDIKKNKLPGGKFRQPVIVHYQKYRLDLASCVFCSSNPVAAMASTNKLTQSTPQKFYRGIKVNITGASPSELNTMTAKLQSAFQDAGWKCPRPKSAPLFFFAPDDDGNHNTASAENIVYGMDFSIQSSARASSAYIDITITRHEHCAEPEDKETFDCVGCGRKECGLEYAILEDAFGNKICPYCYFTRVAEFAVENGVTFPGLHPSTTTAHYSPGNIAHDLNGGWCDLPSSPARR